MQIGIIGSGLVGGALTRLLTKLGHDVYVSNSRGAASLAELAAETGAKPVSVTEAARNGEIVIVAIPEGQITSLPSGLFTALAEGVVVVDAGNYYPKERDGRIAELESSASESRWVSKIFGRPVVKAFNNIFAHDLVALGKPAGTAGRIALPVAGDDAAAKAVIMRLVDAMGYDGVDAGGIDESWRQQPNTPVYVANQDVAGTRRLLSEASSERLPEFRGTDKSPGTWETPA